MKKLMLITIVMLIIFNLSICAQLIVKDKDSTPNTLMQVNDEGSAGSITLPQVSSMTSSTADKLYNIGSSLYWNGTPLGVSGSAGGWTDDGSIVRLSSPTDKIGIGTSSPSVKFSLGLDITPKKLALFDGTDDFYGFGVDWGRITVFTNNTEKMTIKDNGNVGIGTTNPGAKLEVNGDVKIGINGIKFSELYELTGTTGSMGTSTSIPFPSGYDFTNTRILNVEIIHPSFGWYSLGTTVGLGSTLHYIVGTSGITIYYEDIVLFKNKSFRILLMKMG